MVLAKWPVNSSLFLVASFHGFVKNILEKKYYVTNSMFKTEIAKKRKKNSTIAFNMKGA